jgi:hypothetical protein
VSISPERMADDRSSIVILPACTVLSLAVARRVWRLPLVPDSMFPIVCVPGYSCQRRAVLGCVGYSR